MYFRLFVFIIVFSLSGCGYKPVSYYSKEVLGEKIYVNVESSLQDPENTVLIKDAINEVIVSKLHARLTTMQEADAKLYVRLKKVEFEPIQYDKNGFVIAYKTHVDLSTRYLSSKKDKTIVTSGEYDFPIESNSVISDTKRFEAIRFASKKAIEEFISIIGVKGLTK